MLARGLLSVLLIHFLHAFEVVPEEIGWHQTVGIKNAERIRQQEEIEMARIVGGAIAPVHAHPYLAGLLIDIVGMTSPSACGGSLLTATRVLTAAHCWYDGRFQANSITVVLGTPFLFHGGLRVPAHAIAIHPQYDYRTFANDIAMLYLPVHIPFSGAIQPITLPSASLLEKDYTHMWAVAAGYGRYSDVVNPTTNTMAREVLVQVMPLDNCQFYYGQKVKDSNICTSGYGGVGICRGDSGGPLTVHIEGREVLIGVSSFVALAGCELGYPSAYARVTKYIDWINVQL